MAEIIEIISMESVGVPLYRAGIDLSAGNYAILIASCYTPSATDPVVYGSGWTLTEMADIDDGGHPAINIGRLIVLEKNDPTANEVIGLCYGHAITGHLVLISGSSGSVSMDYSATGAAVGSTLSGISQSVGSGADPLGMVAFITEAAAAPAAPPAGWENFQQQTSYHPNGLVTTIATAEVMPLTGSLSPAAFSGAGSGAWASATLVMG
jgi:hypothetical protein